MLNGSETTIQFFFLGLAVKGAGVLAVAWLIATALRRRSAAARHTIWTAASAALLVLPLLSVSLPTLPVPAAFLPSGLVFRIGSATPSSSTPAATTPSQTNPALPQSLPARINWGSIVLLVWMAGGIIALAQIAFACASVWRLRRKAASFPGVNLGSLREPLGIRHPVDVLESRGGSMPMTFGILRPAIFLPSGAAQWSEDRRRMVLLHELAHIRRGDIVTHLLARISFSLYWWNPLAWIAWREFLREQERATDDLVLGTGANPPEYASHLLEVARTMNVSPTAGWAALAMAQRSQLESRLTSILDAGRKRKTTGRTPAWVTLAAAIALVVPVAAVRAQDSAQQKREQQQQLSEKAKAAASARNDEAARFLLDSSLRLTAELSGEASPEYASILVRIGELESRRENFTEAEASFTKAAAIYADRPEAATALIPLGVAAALRDEYPQAMERFQRAQSVDPTHAGLPLMWMASLRRREKNFEEAESLFRSALAVADIQPSEAIVIQRVYAGFLRQQGRDDEAASLEASAAIAEKQNPLPVRAAAADVYRIGGSISTPRLVQKQEPKYSPGARLAFLQGSVVVQVEIAPDGHVQNPRISKSLGLGLDEMALDAIGKWRFEPGRKDGQPVTVAATIEVNFKLL